MTAPLTYQICTECGLCCDGTLFADVETYGKKDAQLVEHLGLETDYDNEKGNPVIPLPCSALQGTRCSVFPHRPITCGSFECGLLLATRQNAFSTDQALKIIRDTRKQTQDINSLLLSFEDDDPSLPIKERISEAASTQSCDGSGAHASSDLSAAAQKLQHMIDRYFFAQKLSRTESTEDTEGES